MKPEHAANTRSRILPKVLGAIILACLVAMLAALVYGHVGGESCGLNLVDSYITEYLKMAPHWPWLVVASFLFALVLFLLAVSFLAVTNRSPWITLGCLLLAATSMANFFAAYAPVRRVEQPPPPGQAWWAPSWWFTSSTARTPYEYGMADAYSDVHYRATRLVVATGVAGILSLALGLIREPECRSFGRFSIAAVLGMSVLFWMGDQLAAKHGLWQRLGFTIMYGWLWAASLQCHLLLHNRRMGNGMAG